MRHLILGTLIGLGLGSTALAGSPDPQMIAPIQKFMESFNAGDMAAAAATHSATEDLAIIDEVPPYLWRGAQAFQSWGADLEKHSKENGDTDQLVKIGSPTRVESSGDRAYVIVPATYSFKRKGAAMIETAQMTFALKKDTGGWLIHGWVWTGLNPKPAGAAKP